MDESDIVSNSSATASHETLVFLDYAPAETKDHDNDPYYHDWQHLYYQQNEQPWYNYHMYIDINRIFNITTINSRDELGGNPLILCTFDTQNFRKIRKCVLLILA